jgi:hypothetical protein
LWQVKISDQQIELLYPKERQGALPITSNVDGVTETGKEAGEEVANVRVILGE